MLPIGTRVKYSQHKLRDTGDRLGDGGPLHHLRVKHHKDAQARRGTVVGHAPNHWSRNVLKVKWDDTAPTQPPAEMLDYLVDPAEPVRLSVDGCPHCAAVKHTACHPACPEPMPEVPALILC